ncbi:hypothetical protein JCM8115_006682 [Rhodotorula mucilaginosa]
MDHDLGAHSSSSSSPYHRHSREPSHVDSTAALTLQDYLASVMSPGTIAAALPPPHASGYEAFASPPADDSNQQQQAQPVNFADILAEFTLAQSAFSPDANGNRGAGDSSAESTSPNLAPTNGNRSDKTRGEGEEAPAAQAKSAQEILLEQLKALYPAAPAPTPAAPSHHAQKPPQQQQQHSSQVEAQPSPHSQPGSTYAPSPSSSSSHGVQLGAEMQAQLQQWLAQSMPTNTGSSGMTSQVPTPTGPPAAASTHMHHHHHQSGSAGFHAPAHLQQQHPHSHHSASPSGYSLPQSPGVASFAHTHSAPSSLHASPMPYYAGTPHEQQQQQQHYPGSSPATPLGHGHPAASSSYHPQPHPVANMPGAAAAAALAALSPLLAGAQPNSPGGGSSLQAQLNALQMLVTANAQAQVHAQMQAHAQNQQANAGGGMHGQQQQPILEHQQATPLQQPSNPQTPFDIRTSAPGTASSSYRETDYMFSPLMSPAMTPHSAFTNASSLPPSVGPVPLVTPSDCFPPLTSPALGPQMFGSDHAAAHQHRHRNSLQGLVDGVGALSTQLPPGSPNGSYYSPRLGPSDPVPNSTGTGPGSGRRGASSGRYKTRPSPLIKPTADTGLDRRRRKTLSAASTPGEKRTTGQKSATASPFLEATTQFSGAAIARERTSSAFSGAPSSHASGASPGEGGSAPSVEASANGSGGSAGGIDTPSPVDLASSVQYHHQPLVAPGGLREAATLANAAISQAGGTETESMGPPPLPPTALNPITPATFMNFASDFDMNGLSSLSPALQAVQNDHFDPVSSALSSLQNSPALLPQAVQSAAPALSMPPPITEESFRAPPQPSASGKASKVRKTPSARASPALKPIDSKGKGKASANSEKAAGAAGSSRGKGGSTKPAKIAPSPKIGPTRPGATPDALRPTRGSGKGKDDLDAGIEELPLPPPATSDIEITPVNKNDKELPPDNRRSSHKVAEQKRRDSLKLCFDELRRILPPILPYTDEQDRRPGDGNVGGQRHGEIDPDNPNKGVSKVALLRRSNEYLGILRERIDRRDRAISSLRSQLSQMREQFGMEELGEDEEEVPGLDLDLDNLDKEEKQAGNLAFYEDLDFDEKVMSGEITRRIPTSRRPSVSGATAAPAVEPKPSRAGTRRSKRQQTADDMDVEA